MTYHKNKIMDTGTFIGVEIGGRRIIKLDNSDTFYLIYPECFNMELKIGDKGTLYFRADDSGADFYFE